MDKVTKINIKLVEYNKKLGNSRLEFNVKNNNIDYVIMNTLRRTIISDIPIYAFNVFNFEKNNSIFHNNYVKLRLKNMPIWGIENNIDFIDTDIKNNIDEDEEQIENDNIELDTEKTVDASSLKQFTMYVTYKNKTNDIVTVTTDDAKFYFAQELIDSPYKIPIPLIKLQSQQEISFSAISSLGVEKQNTIFSPCSICCYKQNDDNDFNFILESRGQINEKRILEVAFINIERNMNNLLKMIKVDNDSDEGILIIHNENHTMGNLIARGLQQHKKIDFAGYNMPHPLSNIIHIHYRTNKYDIKKAIEEVVEYYTELFQQFSKEVNKL